MTAPQPLPALVPPAPTGVHAAALSAKLGLGLLAEYERCGDEAALANGLSRLRTALAEQPAHPARVRWLRWLGLGLAERARRQRSLPDYHEAIECLATRYLALPPADRPAEALTLLEVCWERLWLVRYGDPAKTPAATARGIGEVDQRLALMAPLLTGDVEAVRDARLVAGVTRLERYEHSGLRADLDRGADLLAAGALWDLPQGTIVVSQVGSELTNAMHRLAILDDDPVRLDRAIAVGVRTKQHASPADGTAWLMLHYYLALAYEERINATAAHGANPDVGANSDVDGAVACWRVLLDAGGDQFDWERIG